MNGGVILRLLLRLVLVPLGAMVALAAAGAMLVVTQRDAFQAVLAADPQAQEDYVFALMVAGPLLLRLMSSWAHFTFVPALAGAFIAEAFAIRSWMFHVGNGALSASPSRGWNPLQPDRSGAAFPISAARIFPSRRFARHVTARCTGRGGWIDRV